MRSLSQGSGKGTLSSLLHSTYPELSSISAGDLLRQHISKGTELGKKADEFIKRGDLMDDETMMQMVGKEVEEKGGEVSGRGESEMSFQDDVVA